MMTKANFSDFALKLIEKEKEEKTGILDLSGEYLNEIPDEVRKMDWITVLGLSGGEWSKAGWSEEPFSIRQETTIPEWLP